MHRVTPGVSHRTSFIPGSRAIPSRTKVVWEYSVVLHFPAGCGLGEQKVGCGIEGCYEHPSRSCGFVGPTSSGLPGSPPCNMQSAIITASRGQLHARQICFWFEHLQDLRTCQSSNNYTQSLHAPPVTTPTMSDRPVPSSFDDAKSANPSTLALICLEQGNPKLMQADAGSTTRLAGRRCRASSEKNL